MPGEKRRPTIDFTISSFEVYALYFNVGSYICPLGVFNLKSCNKLQRFNGFCLEIYLTHSLPEAQLKVLSVYVWVCKKHSPHMVIRIVNKAYKSRSEGLVRGSRHQSSLDNIISLWSRYIVAIFLTSLEQSLHFCHINGWIYGSESRDH